MIENFMTVGQQVLILFILIFVGFIAGKTKLLNEVGAKAMTNIVLYVVTPCVVIKAFQRDFEKELLWGLLIGALAAIVIHTVTILISKLLFIKKQESEKKVLEFATIFSNCGFMSLPLQEAVLGDDGVFYGAAFLAVFNVFVWTYGLFIMSSDKKAFSVSKIILNPGIIGTVLGVSLFVLSVRLPEIVITPISYLSNLNTPVPMLIIGYYLSCADLKRAFTSVSSYLSMGVRLIIIPLLTLVCLYFLNIRGDLMVSLIISCSAPVAAITTMFSAKFSRDVELSVSLVSATSLLSIVTMPLVVSLAQFLS